MFLVFKLLEINTHVKSNSVFVNGKNKQKNYIVRVNDTIFYLPIIWELSKDNLKSVKLWYWYVWRKWKYKYKRKFSSFLKYFWSIKKNLIMNYTETYYRTRMGVLLRIPLLGEVLLCSYKVMLSKNLLKKVYLLY